MKKGIYQFVLCTFLSLIFIVSPVANVSSQADGPVTPTLKNFDYKNVTIDGGHMGSHYEEVGSSYLRLTEDIDGLLKGFRERAGLPAPGEDLETGYSDSTYHMFGQLISGLARYYAGTGNDMYKKRVDTLIHQWGLTIEDDGFFFYTDPPKTTHYVYDKMVAALVDAYIYCNNSEALTHLSKITDWAEKNLPRNKHPWTYAAEWYTLSENLYRAYLVTGDERYKDFAQVWHYHEYWDLYANKIDIFNSPPWEAKPDVFHAYSHVNTLSGSAMAYIVTKEAHYLDTIKNAYDFFINEQTFATGGFGPDEMLRPLDGLIDSLDFTFVRKNFETQCGSWAAFKLSKYLMTLTGDDKYGDWVELLLYNGIGASIPTGERAEVMYSSDYHLGGGRKVYAPPWTCCTGTRVIASADYIDQIYFYDDSNLYVNLYTPSTVKWAKDNADITLIQETTFPESEAVEFTINTTENTRFGLMFREPDWLAGAIKAEINGDKAKLEKLESGWLAINREWKDGDKVKITLPMELHVNNMDPEKDYPCAIMYGPVVLSVESTEEKSNPANLIDLDNLDKSLVPIPNKPLHFEIKAGEGDKKLIAKPFYQFNEDELYYIYLDPKWSKDKDGAPPQETPPVSTQSPSEDPTPTDSKEPSDNKDGSPKTEDTSLGFYLTCLVAAIAAAIIFSKNKILKPNK